jgi:hypothetical protein
LIESIVIILAALSRRNCTIFPLFPPPYRVHVTDGTQCHVVENYRINSTVRFAARSMLE